ncbi:glycine zipper 2TM domain-containing protein [Ramlibacter sp. AW1]|uniref:Glycine zipper 2TM domain-containing protein n=1 Tax=Ramlibacter aurantiacus TaxID=2801330 RepID=A0A936ZHZ4_9BURK|nr:glycine zipper 2TM domain-containing protein [Ramlibacter aurantiacus]MBL0420212.1 glycine zipper 2TM domain-containing protein [Ramlibacter aurantiacus]
MKKSLASGALGALTLVAPAIHAQAQPQEVGRVISSVPVIQQVAVPRQICNSQPVVVQQPSSGGGALLGALVGGAAGHGIGDGGGRALATVIGAVGGAMVGDRVEGPRSQLQQQTQCTTQTFYENRTVAYDVTYEWRGGQYTVQMPHDPGPTISLQLVPTAAGNLSQSAPATASAASAATPVQPAQSIRQAPIPAGTGTPEATILREWVVTPPVTYVTPHPVYPAPVYAPYAPYAPLYAPYSYYAPPRVSLSLGYIRHSGRGHRHWR